MLKNIIMSVIIVSSVNLFAHEGHDDAPGALKANHGGTVKAGKEINLEYVVAGTDVKIYPISHDGKELTQAEAKLVATTKSPKGKAEPAPLDYKDGSYLAKVDFKGAYRVEMNVTADVKGKKDSFKFQIEK
jgi:hypothetical protein